jgi:lysophospholipase L1-like esterase
MDRLRLAFLGGSTTFCAEVSEEALTWPALVAAGARSQRTHGSVDYVNAGVGGYRLEQSLLNLERRVAVLEPDVIFIYAATNDLTMDTRLLALEQGVYTGHGDKSSWLAEHSLAWYLIEKNLIMKARSGQARSERGRLQFDERMLSRQFDARLSQLCDAAKARSKLVVLMTFSTQGRRGQTAEELLQAFGTALYYMPYMTPERLLDAYDEYNRVIREVAARQGAVLLDVAHAVPGDPGQFKDSVHFSDSGSQAFAAAVLDALRASPEWLALLAE